MSRKLIITVDELPGLGLAVKVEGSGFNPIEVVGILEHVKVDAVKKMTHSQPNGDRMAQFLGMVAGMASHSRDDDDQN